LICREEDHEGAADYDFDHPHAIDFDLALQVMQQLIRGEDTHIPTYCFVAHKRTGVMQPVKCSPIVILEGIHGLYDARLRALMDLKIFVLTPDDIRLARRSKYT
jgi:uridine kinase